MGLALGAGLVAGAQAAATNIPLFMFAILVLLLASIALIVPAIRRILLFAVIGLVLAVSISTVVGAGPQPGDVPVPEGLVTGTVLSDPRVARTGSHARFAWVNDAGQRSEGRIYFPAGFSAGRGDTVQVSSKWSLDGDERMLIAGPPRLITSAPDHELLRRSIRNHAESSMIAFVPGSAGSLTLGLLIGDDTALSSAERSDLRASGLAHITAVSGWNVSVVVIAVGSVFRAFGARHWRWLLVQLGFLSAYVWIVGLEPPILRAAIMGAVALIALQFGRPSHMVTHLLVAAGIMTLFDPGTLVSLSFQLSFMAMLGLAVAAWYCSRFDGWKQVVLTPAITAGAAGLATAPLLAATFGSLPLMTVPANIVAAPLVPVTTFLGIAVVTVGWVPVLPELLGWATWCVAALILWISRVFASVPGGHHQFAPLTPATTLLVYAFLALAAVPCFPEGRATWRKLDDWVRREPLPAFATGAVTIVVLGIGVLAI